MQRNKIKNIENQRIFHNVYPFPETNTIINGFATNR